MGNGIAVSASEAPATFAARGVCVPFADPRLRLIRVRAEPGTLPDRWDVSVGDPFGAEPRRVPWRQLTGVMQFPPRDMALYFALSARAEKGLDPWDVAGLAAEVDREHGANEAVRAAAVAFEHAAAESIAAAREAVARWMPPDTMLAEATHTALAHAVAPLGTPRCDPGADPAAIFPEDGPLGAAAARLERFRAQIRKFEGSMRGTVAQRALLVAFGATQFRDLLRNEYRNIGELVAEMGAGTLPPEAALEILQRSARRVAFALDGWAPCIDVWDAGLARDGSAALEAMDFIAKTMPSLPRAEAGGPEEMVCWDGIDRQRAGIVRVRVAWIDGTEGTRR